MNQDEVPKYLAIGVAGMFLIVAAGAVAIVAAPVVAASFIVYYLVKRHMERTQRAEQKAELARKHELACRLRDAFKPLPLEELARLTVKAIRLEHGERSLPLPAESLIGEAAITFAEIVHGEVFSDVPSYDPDEPQGYPWARDKLNESIAYYENVLENYQQLVGNTAEAITNFTTAVRSQKAAGGFLTLSVPFIDQVDDVRGLVQSVIDPFFEEELIATGMGQWLRNALDRNLCKVSRIPFSELHTTNKKFVWPSAFKGTPRECVDAYLGGTPLARLFEFELSYTVPHELRFEHMHLCAGTGHGKTQTIQELISRDLELVKRGEASVVVIDSQGDLIGTISRLAIFAEELAGKLTHITPRDLEYPLALNLFDVNLERINSYSPFDRERMLNGVIELYDFVFGGLLGAELTSKQGTAFRYVLRALLLIPDATIHTLRELMEPGGCDKYQPYLSQLQGTARAFFEQEFNTKHFADTKQQVLRRLYTLLENQTFERMFSHPRNKFDLFTEMNAGRVVLIDTAKDLLKQQGTEILGRFFIAMLAQAAQERTGAHRLATYVYIDEAADYFDKNVELVLREARKRRVGFCLAHQYLGQLDDDLRPALAANTSIKMVGGVSDRDARAFAHDMRCDPQFILAQPKGHFALFAKGATPRAMRYRTEFGVLEAMPRMSRAQAEAVRERMRERYAVRYDEIEAFNAPLSDGVASKPTLQNPDTVSTDAADKWGG